MAQATEQQLIQAEEICDTCGARCCKALLMSQNPFNLILRDGDMKLMQQNGLAALLDNHFSLYEGHMIELP
ncbi:MAG: hypothetical protein ACFFFH_15860 [Candidatus Thorarchaeota archaeon]